MPTREPEGGGASATQLSILLSSLTSIIDEEFKRSERLDAKSRNQITIAGSFFAAVQVVVIGLINGSLAATETHDASSFIPWLAIAGGVAAIGMFISLGFSYRAWKLRDDPALTVQTIRNYRDAAREGNPAVGVKLIDAYADVADGRRANNKTRAKAMETAAVWCGLTMSLIAVELGLAFVAVAVQ